MLLCIICIGLRHDNLTRLHTLSNSNTASIGRSVFATNSVLRYVEDLWPVIKKAFT